MYHYSLPVLLQPLSPPLLPFRPSQISRFPRPSCEGWFIRRVPSIDRSPKSCGFICPVLILVCFSFLVVGVQIRLRSPLKSFGVEGISVPLAPNRVFLDLLLLLCSPPKNIYREISCSFRETYKSLEFLSPVVRSFSTLEEPDG